MKKDRKLFIEFSDRKYFLYTIDILLVMLSTLWYCRYFEPVIPVIDIFFLHPNWFFSIIILWTVFAYSFELYNLKLASDVYSSLKNTFIASYITVYLYFFLPYLTPVLPKSRNTVFLFIFIFTSSLLMWRYLYARIFYQAVFLKRIIIVGAGWSGQTMVDVFTSDNVLNYKLGYKTICFIDDDPDKKNYQYKGLKVIGDSNDLPQVVKRLRIDEIVLAVSDLGAINSNMFQKLTECQQVGVGVISMVDLYESLTGKIPIEHAGNEFYLSFPYNKNTYKKGYLFFSRSLDILLGSFGCIIFVLCTPFVALANILFSRGPLFYSQERVGLYGRLFKIVKFRSMIVDAEKSSGAQWAQKNDARITTVGKILRKSRIDELPQFWNVLKGEMSLIGPRPERPVFVAQLENEIPFYSTRHLVKPGITGWAQALYKYGANKEDALIKLQYDLYYIKNRSILLDLKIILKTASVVIRFKGQ